MKSLIQGLFFSLVVAVSATAMYSATAIARVDLLDSNGRATGVGVLIPLELVATKGKLLTEIRDVVSTKTTDVSGRVLASEKQRMEAGWGWEVVFKDGKWSIGVTRTIFDGVGKIDGDDFPITKSATYRVDSVGLGDYRTSGGPKEAIRVRIEAIE